MTAGPDAEPADKLLRSSVVGVFALVGPAIGTVAVLFTVDSIVRQGGNPGGAIWVALLPAMLLGYVFGLGPAFACGLI